MANIVRCKLPSGVHRFKPFTVADYRDFLLVRNDLNGKSPEEQLELIEELLADYFGDYPETYRPYIFIKTFTSSIGKTKLPVQFTCSVCKQNKMTLFDLDLPDLKNPVIETCGIIITLKFPENKVIDTTQYILDNILNVNDGEDHSWESLSLDEKQSVIDSITIEALEDLLKQIKPVYRELSLRCCNTTKSVYDNIISIFKLILNPDEVFSFYQTNHMLVKNHYDVNSVMKMLPIERTIVLSLIEKDKNK